MLHLPFLSLPFPSPLPFCLFGIFGCCGFFFSLLNKILWKTTCILPNAPRTKGQTKFIHENADNRKKIKITISECNRV